MQDLGTLPAGFRETLEMLGLHGMRVLWFERNGHTFSAPEQWDSSAVAMTTTHDLPTVAGWWHGSDIAMRDECGRLGVGEHAADVLAELPALRLLVRSATIEVGVVIAGLFARPSRFNSIAAAAIVKVFPVPTSWP